MSFLVGRSLANLVLSFASSGASGLAPTSARAGFMKETEACARFGVDTTVGCWVGMSQSREFISDADLPRPTEGILSDGLSSVSDCVLSSGRLLARSSY